MRQVLVSHSYYCHKLRFLSLSLSLNLSLSGHLRKTAQIWRNAFALSPVIYVWHLGRVCSMTWHKYLHVKFFLAQVMPLTSVCHSLPSPSLSLCLSLCLLAYLLPFFRLKKVIYFTLTLTSTLFTPSTFSPPFPTPSPKPLSLSAFGATMAT